MVGEQEAARKSFYVVYVPTDEAKELEEWTIALPDDKEEQIGCLTDRLRQHFKESTSANASTSTKEQQEIFKKQLLSQLPPGTQMNDAMLQMMLQMDSLVDSIPLVLNTKAVQHVGVNMYVDDKGTAKGLPTNIRASAIAQACGKMVEVKGDAFIARVFDNDDDFVRLDFRLGEVTMDAEWIQLAKTQPSNAAATSAAEAKAAISAVTAAARKSTPTVHNVCSATMCSADATMRCSRCKQQYYCSAKCQKAHWKTHKPTCKPQ
ncbi:hypothetical protein Poli38472_003186 [Pythium oligandrum]|uniref:MYND-type domain-containing protein n=1 Tax=Pythium oligandrum TaxID=41045 RepID=A0A8K1C627_PYTOL|nr:hypothetical protein Poli38472_003186 [Pythium oligandrum]|eukprot:TMW57261.1 hypothetical protein Poli38472_003186 [Pythium oligandrum]